jgi:hypothetical protein
LERSLVWLVVGGAIWSVAEPVLVRVMVCCVAMGPGTFEKMSAAGLRARPGSGLPNPVRVAAMRVVVVGIVRVPVKLPVVLGVKRMLTKQEALGAREPEHAAPPVG